MTIYQPEEDSYLLNDVLRKHLLSKNKKIKILDMGTGSGILASTCKESGFESILTSDINNEAVTELKKKGFKSIQSDLYSNIRQKFDLIIFNPPYLPKDKEEPEDSSIITTAGKEGNEIILKFLGESKNHLKSKGEIMLLFSSLSRPEVILKKSEEMGYKNLLLDKKKLFFEELYVYLFH